MYTAKRRLREVGQSLIELALVLVFVIILVVGIVDLGRVLFYYQSMRDASQEAVAYAAAFPLDHAYLPNCTAIRVRVLDNVPDLDSITVMFNNDDCATTSAAVIAKEACTGNSVTVIANKFGYPLIMPVIGQLIGRGINLSATTTATIITPMCVP